LAARVIHFGVDDCYRLSVLRRAGYVIHDCSNLIQLCAALDADAETDAVMVNDSDGSVPEHAISLARSRSSAPIVLFPNSSRSYRTDQVDLVVPSFTPPQEWLLDLANLIVHSRAIQEYSRLLQEQSGQLCRESAQAREKSREERARSRREAARNAATRLLGQPEGESDPNPK
jgi:hypothetical protein